MAEHPNAALCREALEKFTAGEREKWMSAIADDIVWWQIGASEPIRGKAALLESMRSIEGVEFELDVHDVLAGDDHTVALVQATVRAGDQELSYRTAEILHVEDDKITERWAFSDNTEAISSFFSQFGEG